MSALYCYECGLPEFAEWVRERWDGRQPAQHVPHPVPVSPIAALGPAGEVGEVVELLKKHMRDGKHPGEALKLELGDVLHYLLVIGHAYDFTLEEIMQANIDKLTARDAARGAK